jgi:predicted helicase
MASCTICHLKLEMLLRETGYVPRVNNKQQRLRVFLTNSLEEAHPDTGTLFASWLSREAKEANLVKRDTPVMVVLGNPPYAVSSSNKGEWISKLIEIYKQNVSEINKNALSDDYVKFIRLGQHYIEKNGEGILAYISNNSFIDGMTHRQMRKKLLGTFNKIFILNLHGNSKRKETASSIAKDENVFDIQQGVSINIFIKNKNIKKRQCNLFSFDLYGQRKYKYEFLNNSYLNKINWENLKPASPYFFFTKKDFSNKGLYEKGFALSALFKNVGSGIKFRKDNLLVKNHYSPKDVMQMLSDINNLDNQTILEKYNFKETKDWKLDNKRKCFSDIDSTHIRKVEYRPFDMRFTYYPLKTISEIIARGDSRKNFMRHILKDNYLLIATKINRQLSLGYFWISCNLIDLHLLDTAGDSLQSFPLYVYPETNEQLTLYSEQERTPNLNQVIVKQIAAKLSLNFTNEKEKTKGTFAPIDILDYIYAVLHSPTYRERYKEFLKIDFPRIPYPKGKNTFWQLVKLGGELRQIHLLESSIVEQGNTSYPNDGNNIVTRKISKNDFEIIDKEKGFGRVWINDQQCFDGVPVLAWEFYIGGYQPAQKWLKDRKGRKLTFEDILHYQKIIVALTETDRLMQKIDKV